jgi:hypothetical protein
MPQHGPKIGHSQSVLHEVAIPAIEQTKIRLPDNERENALPLNAGHFIARWQQSSAAERANYALFLSELCDCQLLRDR